MTALGRPSVARWLAETALEIGALAGTDATAELLVALAHETRDRSVWGGNNALSYWERLPGRVMTATYAGPTLAAWWERISRDLGCTTHYAGVVDRADLARSLACGQDKPVLAAMRKHSEALCLRVRLATETRRGRAEDATSAAPSVDLDAIQETLL